MQINLLFVHSESIGYGRLGVNLARELETLGVDVYDDLPVHPDVLLSGGDRKVNEGRRSGICETTCWVSVPSHARGWWGGQHSVISTMWEATILPPSFRENLHAFDQVIVPSEQNAELFSRYHSDITVVQLGVDPAVWHYEKRREPGADFTFLIGGSGARKGTMLAYEAFLAVFGEDASYGDGPAPRLVLKSPKGEEQVSHPRVEMMSGRLTPEAEVALYRSAHCYLQPSRGEGFGLQPLQAIAQGLPTILTDAHGHASFAHLGIPLSSRLEKAEYFIYGDAGEWWEPNFDELCDGMRWVYDNYTAACDKAKASAQVVADEFTWRRTAERFIAAIGPEKLGPYTGDGSWFTPPVRKYPVVLTQDWAADIAGTSYRWTRGVRYFESADVKRLMFEAGLLDPVCLVGDDPGLDVSQLDRIGDYSAAHGYCPTCSQKLNTQPTRADDLMAAL